MKLLMTTKNSAAARRKGGIIMNLVLILIGLGILVFSFSVFDKVGVEFQSVLILFIALMLLFDGIVQILLLHFKTSSYVDIYDDHMEGKGMQGLELKNFSLKNVEVKNITVSGMEIDIHTNAGVFKITSNKQVADKVFNLYQSQLHR